MTQYYSGTIEQWHERAGYGFIRSQDVPSEELLLVHNRSLRDRNRRPHVGDAVLFKTEIVPRGLLAIDVHPEAPASYEAAGNDRISAVLASLDFGASSGLLRTADGRDAFFRVADVDSSTQSPQVAHAVTCRLVATERGLQAVDIVLEAAPEDDTDLGSPAGDLTPSSDTFLAQALAARERRSYDAAAALYDEGIRRAPSVALVLSYAAFEKNRNRKEAAMRVYEEGIRLYPTHAKLREDAGVVAASIGENHKAVRLLLESLEICRRTGAGEKGALLALARTSYNAEALEDAVYYYDLARKLFERDHKRLQDSDLMQMHLAMICTRHHRGNVTTQFLRKSGLRIIAAELLGSGDRAEFAVELPPELSQSYGLANNLLVHCAFNAKVQREDIDSIEERLLDNADYCEPHVSLLVVGSLHRDLQQTLWRRVEERRHLRPVIVPLQQSEIETSPSGLTAIRSALDRWLFRRDLFAVNSPVVGRRFFGRGKALAELREAIASSASTAVFGLRKVGKTSLLQESQRRCSETGDVVAYVDLLRVPGDVSDCRWLYWKIASDLRIECERRGIRGLKWRLGSFGEYCDIPDGLQVATVFDSDLTRLLRHLAAQHVTPRAKVVLLLDEIERLLPSRLGKERFTGFFDFFSYVRGIAQESEDFVLIVTGANASITETSQFDGRDNPVFNFFREIYLPLLEPAECALMMRELGRGMGMQFNGGAVDAVYALTGGHPFFARQLCSFIADQHRERPIAITRALAEGVVDQYLDARTADFQEIVDRLARDFPQEQALCVDLAIAGGALPIEQVRGRTVGHAGSTLRHLIGYQLIATDQRNAWLTIELFTRWLRQRYISD